MHRPGVVWGIVPHDRTPHPLPEVDFYGPVMREQVAYFRGPTPKQQGVSRSYVFLRMDDPVVVSVITQAQYISIAGAENFKP